MKESNNVEPFEVDNPEELYSNKIHEYHFLAKIIIAQAIVIVLLLITLLITNSNVKEYNSDISNINLKKYMIADGNKKLDRTLNEDFKVDFAYDEETKKKDNEIKSKEKLIKDYKHKIKKLKKALNKTQPIEEILKINEGKTQKMNELKSSLDQQINDFRNNFNTKIFDSPDEVNDLKTLIKNDIENPENKEIGLNLCYSYENKTGGEINYEDAILAINYNENKVYSMLLKTSMYQRYGIILTHDHENEYLIFDLNNRDKKDNLFEREWLHFKFDRTNLKLLLNNMKDFNFTSKNQEIDYIKYANITQVEIYKVY
jgi:hypothetical protein